MRFLDLKLKAILIATIFSIVVAGVALFIDHTYNNWKEEVIHTNKVLCEVLVKQLNNASLSIIDSLNHNNFFEEGYKSSIEVNNVNKVLSRVTSNVLESVGGMEGGFYFSVLEDFKGYAYPTSPPPKPVYGPPPRSYNIIKEQTENSIKHDSIIIQLHQFDPAIFPLATHPVKLNGKVIGAAWVRIHIERELPQLTLVDILNIAAVLSLLGFIIAVTVSFQLRKRVETIRRDLETLEVNYTHRVKMLPGVFGFIAKSINKMVDKLQLEHKKREQLEHELHQKDKMASLGTLIAGVAHEVKTPLAIIKTRIQMWQQKLQSTPDKTIHEDIISNKSLQLVINEINRLSTLVSRLLIFSRPVDDNFQPTDINKLIGDVLTLFKSKRYLNKAEIIFSPGKNLPLIETDPNKIEQVILNIVTNSFESIKSNGLIEITTVLQNGSIEISIKDNGAGIKEDAKKNIFDPFYTTKTSGTGLGLSIAYEIVKAHNGTIEFFSEVSKGSTFLIKLPSAQNK